MCGAQVWTTLTPPPLARLICFFAHFYPQARQRALSLPQGSGDMDSTDYPHILDAIIAASAAVYAHASSHPASFPTTLNLRGTSRAVRDAFDAHTFQRVAWKNGEWLTPSLRPLPCLYHHPPCIPKRLDRIRNLTRQLTRRRSSAPTAFQVNVTALLAHTRVLPAYDAVGPGPNLPTLTAFTLASLQVVRTACTSAVPTSVPLAPTLLERIDVDSPGARVDVPDTARVDVPDGVRRYVLGLPVSVGAVEVLTLPHSLREVVTLLGTDASMQGENGGRGEQMDYDPSSVLAHSAWRDFAARGGKMIFVLPKPFLDGKRQMNTEMLTYEEWWEGADALEREWFSTQYVNEEG